MFWLTGSQKFHLMQGITESLTGRVAVLDLLGLSQAEINGKADTAQPFLPTPAWLEQARQQTEKPLPLPDVYRRIWRSSYPRMALDDTEQREIDLLIERDNTLYPVEFKKTASPNMGAAKHLPDVRK